MSITQARDIAASYRKLLREGRDPLVARSHERAQAKVDAAKSIRFDDAAAGYSTRTAPDGAASAPAASQGQPETYASPVFGDLPVAAIDTGLVMRAVNRYGRSTP